MKNNKTICLNSKVNGRQPSIQDRIYSIEGISTALTTCFHPNILVYESDSDREHIETKGESE